MWPRATGPAVPPRAVCKPRLAGEMGRAARRPGLAVCGAGAAAGKLNGGARAVSRRRVRRAGPGEVEAAALGDDRGGGGAWDRRTMAARCRGGEDEDDGAVLCDVDED